MAEKNVTIIVPATETEGFVHTPNGLELRGTFGRPRIVRTPDARAGKRPAFFEAHSAQIDHAKIDAPPVHVVHDPEGAKVVASTAVPPVAGDGLVTALGSIAPQLDYGNLSVRITIEPKVKEAAATATHSLIAGLARTLDDGTVECIGVGIVGKTRQTSSPSDALFGSYIKVGTVEHRQVIPSTTAARVVDVPETLSLRLGTYSPTQLATQTIRYPSASEIPSYVMTASPVALTEEQRAMLDEFFREAKPALVVLDPTGDGGDSAVFKELTILG